MGSSHDLVHESARFQSDRKQHPARRDLRPLPLGGFHSVSRWQDGPAKHSGGGKRSQRNSQPAKGVGEEHEIIKDSASEVDTTTQMGNKVDSS